MNLSVHIWLCFATPADVRYHDVAVLIDFNSVKWNWFWHLRMLLKRLRDSLGCKDCCANHKFTYLLTYLLPVWLLEIFFAHDQKTQHFRSSTYLAFDRFSRKTKYIIIIINVKFHLIFTPAIVHLEELLKYVKKYFPWNGSQALKATMTLRLLIKICYVHFGTCRPQF